MQDLKEILESIILFDEHYNTKSLKCQCGDRDIIVEVSFKYNGENYYVFQQSKVSPNGSLYALCIYIDNQETNYDIFLIRSIEVELAKKQVG